MPIAKYCFFAKASVPWQAYHRLWPFVPVTADTRSVYRLQFDYIQQSQVEEFQAKLEQTRQQHEQEVDKLKSGHAKEVALLTDKIKALKAQASDQKRELKHLRLLGQKARALAIQSHILYY
jgi:hypothetical protein